MPPVMINEISVVPTHNNLTAQFNKTFQTLWRMNLQETLNHFNKIVIIGNYKLSTNNTK